GFPRYNKPVSVDLWPAAAYLDLDFDGVKDLFIGSNENMMTQNIHISHFYKNKGTNSKPNFDFVTRDFMGTQLVDMGRASAPAFYDYDNDGDKDLVVGTGWDNQQSHDTSYVLYLYKNIGTDTLPEYTLVDTNWLQINQYKLAPAMPAFGDLNGDGKMDLLIGNFSGRLTYLENQGNNFVYITDYYDSIDVNLYSAPSIADLNKDGKNDLIIGSNTGNIYYYQNNGNMSYPKFDLITEQPRLKQIQVSQQIIKKENPPTLMYILTLQMIY
ncbi:MAG: VCBS repeat-containing protein, partial [Bacteroidetes bacterium]|nr:VCBS repeat-containing protein [Bacteroidota bacterium]